MSRFLLSGIFSVASLFLHFVAHEIAPFRFCITL